ncbi:TonB-dependent receptor [Horticoccus sp. 23ND18S-11]|uniref:TonB-dependent receptor n=1 Tax=Horticoccus sp. 23ND18S-11 TaxID=3391832 RepID=UPI0039C9300C
MKTLSLSSSWFRRALGGVGLLVGFLGVVAPAALAQRAGTGVITGQVVNETTRTALTGAAVTLESDPRVRAFSEDDGSFRLEGVPAGEQTVVVDYTGLDAGRVRASVTAGGTTAIVVRLTAGIYRLQAFEVSSVREGQAAAISSQRAADNIKTSVSTDAFGNVADSNLGNLLVKMSGIGGERDEGDVFQVSVRGMSADLNSVTVDGTRLSGATTRGSGRAFEIDKVSTSSIEAIEVVKAATPDMDGDSIGGSINLKTKSSFDRTGRVFDYTVGLNAYAQRGTSYPSASFSYSDVYGADRRLGVVVSGSFNRTSGPRSAFRAGFTNPTFTAPAPMTDFQLAEDEIRLDRSGASVKLEYKLNAAASVFLAVMYNNFRDIMDQHKQRIRRNNGTAVSTDDVITTMTNGQFEYEMESRVRTVKTLRVQAGGKLAWRGFQVDYDGSVAPSTGFEKRQDLIMRGDGVNYVVDRTNRLHFPRITRTGGFDPSNYDNFATQSINRKDFHADDEISSAQLNVKRAFATALPTYLKGGVRYRFQEKKQDRAQDVWTYVGRDGVAGRVAATGVNDDNLNRFRDDGHRYLPINGFYSELAAWPDWRAVHREIVTNPSVFLYNRNSSVQNELVNDGKASEGVSAGYLQGNVKLGKLSVLAGARMENTRVSGTGPLTDTRFPTTQPEQRFGGKITRKSSYTDLFPSVHLRYEPLRDTLIRASVSTGIGRPSFNDLMPITTINTAANSITQNNAGLKPQRSTGFDLSIERYLKPIGVLSVGVFQKEIKDYIFSVRNTVPGGANNGFDGLYEGFDYNTKTNGGWARVKGFEANYQQQFSFLPGWLGGFGAFANYTRLVTRGTFTGTVIVDKLSNFTPIASNVGLSYIRSKLTLRGQLNYVGERLVSYNALPALWQFQEQRSTVDVSAKYQLNPRLGLFIDAFNVFNEKNFIYQGLGTRPVNSQYYGTRLSGGITGRF